MKKLPMAVATMTLVTVACAGRNDGQIATTAEPAPDAGTEQMAGERDVVLAPSPGFEVEGDADVEALGQGTRVDIDVRGAASNAMLPWHLHEGICGSGGAIVGDPAAYPPLAADLDGTASSEADIQVTLTPGSDYHVNVHKSPSELETIVACGEVQAR
ncbi:MAG TPA: hypothetical protein VFP98_09950 [Candidatus Polarisedimenticolia bacterium]|nr:hypothetical protein [Candidatus Polarisedimenticolia bacterium]